MTNLVVVIVVVVVIAFAALIIKDVRKSRRATEPTGNGKKVSTSKKKHSLQDYLPLQGFHHSGAMMVDGKFHRLIRVGDVNLYSMSFYEIENLRDQFKQTLVMMNEPFQISVQARRANYTDYLKDTMEKIDQANAVYQNPVFFDYTEKLKAYLVEEAAKPRTDRENLVITGVTSRFFGTKDEKAQIERLNDETAYMLGGLHTMRVPFEQLSDVEMVEAIQNFYSRDRAVSQRYRDALHNGVHTATVVGEERVDERVFQAKKSAK